jgi:murein DD-endopeptidase MepM/ murein hydrolase activator NlpD
MWITNTLYMQYKHVFLRIHNFGKLAKKTSFAKLVLKQALANILILTLELMSLPVFPAFALDAPVPAQQTTPANAPQGVSYATSSAEIIPDITAAQNPFEENPLSGTPQNQPIQTHIQFDPASLSNQQPTQLAVPLSKPATKILPLAKKTFTENEPVAFTVANAAPQDLKISVLDPLGKLVDPYFITVSASLNNTSVSLNPSRIGFRPGKYTIRITDATGKTTTQNFTWGVLALNTNKSIYTPGQTAHIAMSVLDEKGVMVCDAQVTLVITDPTGVKTQIATAQNTTPISDQPVATSSANQTASASATTTTSSATDSASFGQNTTASSGISVNPQCFSHNYSLTPDYETTYPVHTTGKYTLTLSATTKSGTNTITDSFSVASAVPFDVERVSATRIYPVYKYPMLFHITAHQDFNGTIIETAPPNFAITANATGSSQEFNASQLVMPLTDMQEQFGVSSLSLATPFSGNHLMTQGFGVAMTDPLEKPFYALYGLAGHDGLDFGMPIGTPVYAADDGTVALAGDGAYGTTIVIAHSWGQSYYGHLSKTEVKVGQKITKGQEIGLSGNTGHTTGPHLHFGIKPKNPNMQNGFYGKVDPLPYLNTSTQGSPAPSVWTTKSTANANRVISWNVSLKNGDSIDLGYNYKAPGLSPELYSFGPLTFISNNKQTVFQEARLWQVAVDGNSTAGPNNCGTAVDDSSVGTIAWTNPGNACTSGQLTQIILGVSHTSHYLKVTNFGFTSGQIPTGSNIIGIQFSVKRNSGATTVSDNAIRDVKGGTIDSGNDHSAGIWPSSLTAHTYGTTSDLWGQTWAASDITASTFGIAISAHSGGTSGTGSIGAFVTATITFNSPPNAPSQDAPANNAVNTGTSPVFNMTATDPESDNLQYKVTIYSDNGCSSVVQTDDETSSNTGWSGQNATVSTSNDSYTSGTQGTFTTQTPLSKGTQYWWKASAIDPLGSNTFTDSATCNTFITSVAPTFMESGTDATQDQSFYDVQNCSSSNTVAHTGQSHLIDPSENLLEIGSVPPSLETLGLDAHAR